MSHSTKLNASVCKKDFANHKVSVPVATFKVHIHTVIKSALCQIN